VGTDLGSPLLLEEIGRITIPATSHPFVVRDKFVVDRTPINISFLGSLFQGSPLLERIEEPGNQAELRYANLTRTSEAGPILEELGDEAEIMFAQIWALMERQPNGEEGILLTNEWANMFFVQGVAYGPCQGVDDGLGVVRVHWGAIGDAWAVLADRMPMRPEWSKWFAGSRVFSHSS